MIEASVGFVVGFGAFAAAIVALAVFVIRFARGIAKRGRTGSG